MDDIQHDLNPRREYATPTIPETNQSRSKAQAGSFEALADALACAAGMRLCKDGAAHRRAGSRRQHHTPMSE